MKKAGGLVACQAQETTAHATTRGYLKTLGDLYFRLGELDQKRVNI